jgi:predicted nicotinamide N-methyase
MDWLFFAAAGFFCGIVLLWAGPIVRVKYSQKKMDTIMDRRVLEISGGWRPAAVRDASGSASKVRR